MHDHRSKVYIQEPANPHLYLSPILQTRYNDWSILHWRAVAPIVLYHEIDSQTQFPTAMSRHSLTKRPVHNLRIINYTRDIVPSAHEPLVLSWLAVDILGEDLHHVLLRICCLLVAAMPVLWNIECTVVVEQS